MIGSPRALRMEEYSTVSYYRFYLTSWGPSVLGLTVLSMSLVGVTYVPAGLYECRSDAGKIIYTDSPAQLDRCQPVGSGAPSRLGVVGGASPSLSGPPASAVPALPDATVDPSGMAPPGGQAPSGGSPVGGPIGATEESTCTPGLNPLNPLSAPPCASTAPSTPSPATGSSESAPSSP